MPRCRSFRARSAPARPRQLWVSTAYLVAEIVMIPLTGWFSRIFGIRDFLLLSTVLFTAFSVMCGMSSSLTMMIVGRIGQSFFGGAMIPTALTIVSTRLPPAQQPIGIAFRDDRGARSGGRAAARRLADRA